MLTVTMGAPRPAGLGASDHSTVAVCSQNLIYPEPVGLF